MIRSLVVVAALAAVGCGGAEDGVAQGEAPPAAARAADAGEGARVLAREMARIDAEAARVDSVFQPLPVLRPAQEGALRRFGNAEHLARARALGVGRGLAAERIDGLLREGALVRLADSPHWVVRDSEFSRPLAVPALHALLVEVGERFQARLAELGAPAFRLEVTSVLRSADDQGRLRRVNPNAAAGASAHEFGTTADVLYSAFAAPARPWVEIDAGAAAWARPLLERYAAVAAERVAGRRSLELSAVLGEVLIRMQDEGKVRVTMERLQPVFHMTVGRGM